MFTRFRLSIILAAVAAVTLLLAVSCGTASPQQQAANPQQPQQPAAPAAAQAPEGKTASQAPGMQTGAQTSAKATPVAMPLDAIKTGGILRTVHRRSPLHFRLDIRSAIDETSANAPLFNQLLALQHPDFVNIGADLAKEWDVSEDGLTFTFKLEENVINHKGSPWTSRDAKWTLDFMTRETDRRPPHDFVSVAGDSTIESMETPDDNTLIVKLKQQDGLFLANMGVQRYALYTEADFDIDESMDSPIGTGPFFLESHQPGEKLVYRRHDQYFKEGLPYLDGIDIFIIRDVAAKLAAFEAMRLDLILMGSSHGMFPENILPISDRHPGEITFYPGQHPVFRGIKFNYRKEGPWQDKRVRQAINLSINRDEICDALPNCIMGDFMPSATYGPVDRASLAERPGFAVSGPAKEAELALALDLMSQAGFPDGFEATALCRDIADYRDHVCPVVEFLLRDKLNIRLTLDVQESGAWVEKHNTGDWSFEAGSAGSARVDHPYDWLDYVVFCDEPPVNNITGYCNPELDALMLEMRKESDVAKLKPMSLRALDILYEEMVYVPLFWPARYPTYWNYVQNVPDEHFSGQYSQGRRMEQIWIDR